MCENPGELLDKHLGLLHALSYIQAINEWIQLMEYYTLDLKRRGISDEDIINFFKARDIINLIFPYKNEKASIYLMGHILTEGLDLHRISVMQRWSLERARQAKLPAKYAGSEYWDSWELSEDIKNYITDTILEDLHAYSLGDGCDHLIQLYAAWGHTIPTERVMKDRSFNSKAIKDEYIIEFAIGKSWENADWLEKKVQYFIEDGDYRGIFDVVVLANL
jgi:hypothetical protein